MSDYRLYAIRVFTLKWEESVRFYRDVVGLPPVHTDEALGWAQFQVGAAYLGVERCDPDDDEAEALVGRFVGVSLAVDDVQAEYRRLRARGVRFMSEPQTQPWGGTLAHFEDPDGNVITLLG
jgi:predicted enzyme related to lactoylglutathione lyase